MTKIDVQKVCRLCCENRCRLRSLFEQRQEYPLPLGQIIFDVSRLEVESDDGLPQKICKYCVSNLLKIYESIEFFRINDLKLRTQLCEALDIEIKQEELQMDVEVLEEALTHDLTVDEIFVKTEVEEQCLDAELYEESAVNGETTESVNLDINDGVAAIEEIIVESDKKDDARMGHDNQNKDNPMGQSNQNEDPLKKQYRRKTKQETQANGTRKIKRSRKKLIDRPRMHDYKCYICKSESHGSSEALIAHLNSNHRNIVPYTCPECVMDTIVIKGVEGLNAHMRQHLNPEKCPHCDRRLSDKSALAQHIKTYHLDGGVQRPSECKYCGEVYPSKGSLRHHMKLHTTAASCEICGKVFKERRKLHLHIQRRHEKLKKHECSICKKKLGSLDSVQTHMKIYHSNRTFQCSYCPRTYGLEYTLRVHEEKHAKNPEFLCKKDWTEHYTVVEGQEDKQGAKKKKCNLCGMITTAMFYHLSSVHFPTEYRCATCGDVFKQKNIYEIHVLEHKYGKAHQCPICSRKFSFRKNLIVHLRTKKHRDHPLAQSLDWLGINPAKSKSRKIKDSPVDDGAQIDQEILTST